MADRVYANYLKRTEAQPDDHEFLSVRKFASDMIIRAVLDMHPHSYDGDWSEDAIGWILDEDGSVFDDKGISFVACCEILGICPKATREGILRHCVTWA